ncbi:MAG: hypothetical protein RLZ17_199 [Actinomycetota bacterium]
MQNAGFIIASYILTIGSVLLFAFVTLRRARESAKLVEDKHKPWI